VEFVVSGILGLDLFDKNLTKYLLLRAASFTLKDTFISWSQHYCL